jgi:hypothetical protein
VETKNKDISQILFGGRLFAETQRLSRADRPRVFASLATRLALNSESEVASLSSSGTVGVIGGMAVWIKVGTLSCPNGNGA